MNCARFESLILEWMDQTLDPHLQRAMKGHAAGCADCAGLLQSVSELQRELAALPPVPAPPEMVDWILDHTGGRSRIHSLWSDLVLPTLSPFLSRRFAFGSVFMCVFISVFVGSFAPALWAASSDLSPSALRESAGRLSSQISKKSAQINGYGTRFLGEIQFLKQDLYGRLDYYLGLGEGDPDESGVAGQEPVADEQENSSGG
ncbi:MAG: anti-sigma factor family protein [Acidobacteriota bacterium]